MAMSSLSAEQLDDLQGFLKDWLRHAGRSQSDLRRALHAPSIRMPVLLEELRQIHRCQGLIGLAARLCEIEQDWRERGHGHADPDLDEDELDGLADSFGQLDLLLQEIREEA